MPLRLPIPFGNRNELIVELGVDLRSELLGHRGWHTPPLCSTPIYFSTAMNQDKSSFTHVTINK
jgi:hypothetical protein